MLSASMLAVLPTYLGVGAVAGLVAGLFGVGGGIIFIPLLLYCMVRQGVPDEFIMHLSLGTSMATIMFTAISSTLAHHRRGAVQWNIVYRIVPGILIGTFLGSCIASRMTTGFLKVFFVLFLYCVAIQMVLDKKPKPSRHLPGTPGMFGVGNAIGVVSSLVGIGGGTMSIPFMMWCNIAVHEAIGTSAAIGFAIAFAGTAGFAFNGFFVPDLPAHSLGFIYLPALAGIAFASMLTAPLGAKLAHSLPVVKLKRIFAVLFLFVATKMLIDLI